MSCVRWPISCGRAVQHRQTLLIDRFLLGRLADRRRITRIRLAALDIGLDVLRRH
jgi:hypothetical protein